MNIKFNNKGVPLLFECSSVFGNTEGAPKDVIQATDTSLNVEYTELGGMKIVSWGRKNDFPNAGDKVIYKTGVLNTGLKFIRNFTLGQGIYPCRVTGYDINGNEILEPVNDPHITKLLNSRMVRRYLEKSLRDYLKFGISFNQLIFSVAGDKIVGLNNINAYYARVSERKNNKEKCVISGKWPDTPADKADYDVYDILMEYDPDSDLVTRKGKKDKKDKSVIYVVRDSWSNKESYSQPIWMAAYTAGWIDIARNVPKFLNKVFQNMCSLKWHIQIPYTFWDKRFPESDYQGEENWVQKRQADIQTYMDSIERNLTGIENADKPIFTHYTMNEFGSGKIEEEWKITALDGKSSEKEKLVTSAAANSEILFCLMVNPNVLGAGMPGGAYGNNQGGSNLREAFLVNIANAWVDRQNILDPLRTMLNYNGYEDVELRFRNTVLTTLDNNKGTAKTLS